MSVSLWLMMNCLVPFLKIKVREPDVVTLFPPVCFLRAPVYFGGVLRDIGGNHPVLWSVLGKVESLRQPRGPSVLLHWNASRFSCVTDPHL